MYLPKNSFLFHAAKANFSPKLSSRFATSGSKSGNRYKNILSQLCTEIQNSETIMVIFKAEISETCIYLPIVDGIYQIVCPEPFSLLPFPLLPLHSLLLCLETKIV